MPNGGGGIVGNLKVGKINKSENLQITLSIHNQDGIEKDCKTFRFLIAKQMVGEKEEFVVFDGATSILGIGETEFGAIANWLDLNFNQNK